MSADPGIARRSAHARLPYDWHTRTQNDGAADVVLTFLLLGAGIGFVAGVSPGPGLALVVTETLKSGWLRGAAVAPRAAAGRRGTRIDRGDRVQRAPAYRRSCQFGAWRRVPPVRVGHEPLGARRARLPNTSR